MMSILAAASGGVDWGKVLEIALGSTFTVGLGLLSALLVHLFYRRRNYSKQERVLLDLARIRRKGVALRNDGLKKLDGEELAEWLAKANAWKVELFTKAQVFSPVEAERLDTLDWMEHLIPRGVKNPDHIRSLSDINGTLKRLDRMLEQRFRPTLAP